MICKNYTTGAEVREGLLSLEDELKPDKVFVLTDKTVAGLALPKVGLEAACTLTIEPGDENKNLETLAQIWASLSTNGATRRSLLLNVGGGMVSDIGGFAGATFKRGIRFANVTTTLLGAVDAALGGKTGINLNGLKNEVGAFADPLATFCATELLKTLPYTEVLSGYGEVVKSALIASEEMTREVYRLSADHDRLPVPDARLIEQVQGVKLAIVEQDPREQGLRKALNFGHTVGHAFESLALRRGTPLAHGICVAQGLLVELVMSHMACGLDSGAIDAYWRNFLQGHYPTPRISCDDYAELLGYMSHDKKNARAGEVRFAGLEAIGTPVTDCKADESLITSALDISRDLWGI